MPMTVVVTRDVPGRFRGFLASCMCEIAPGVYTAPRMSRGVRERVWSVMESWWLAYPDASVLMTWPEAKLPGGQNLRTLGLPRQDLRDHCGVFLTRRGPRADESPSPEDPSEQGASTSDESEANGPPDAVPNPSDPPT